MYLAQEIAVELNRNPELKGVPCYSSPSFKHCGVYKLRIPKANNKGKSNGYRIIFLLITYYKKGYVLDIADHTVRDDLTDNQKNFCNNLAKLVNEAICKEIGSEE